nr:MAG TPA: hypothetical protein [Caudoviricetes sp.]
MNTIKIFENEQFGKVRIAMSENNEPFFCLADVCQILDLIPSKVAQRLDKDVLSKYPLETAGGIQQANFVDEDGLYDTILDSRKPEAKKFRKWVTSEVLPCIRKTGGYIATKMDDTPEEIMARALIVAQETIKRKEERLKQLEEKNAQLQPKAEFADCIMKSKDCITIGDLANILKQSCLFSKGKNALACWMRNNGYLLQKGIRRNMPTQKSMALGLMRVIETTSHAWNGTIIINKTVGITSLGQRHFIAQFRALLSSKESYEIEW